MSSDTVLHIPDGITVPCVENYALFNTRDLDPDVIEWMNSDPVTQGYVATKKHVAQEKAVKVCRTCPLIQECRQWAFNTRQYGILGGTTEAERLGGNVIDKHIETGEIVTLYTYVELKLSQKVPRRVIAEELGLSMATIRHIHTINLIVAPSAVVDDEDVYFLAKKLFKAGVPQRLVADRLGGTLHYVRRMYHLGAEKKHKTTVAVKVEKNFHKRWSRLTPTTVAVYDYLSLRAGGRPVDKETVLEALTPELSEEEKQKGVPKGRTFKTRKHRLRIGARRAISAALRAGVRSGVVERATAADGTGKTVEYYRFSPEWSERWKEYSKAKDKKTGTGSQPAGTVN